MTYVSELNGHSVIHCFQYIFNPRPLSHWVLLEELGTKHPGNKMTCAAIFVSAVQGFLLCPMLLCVSVYQILGVS